MICSHVSYHFRLRMYALTTFSPQPVVKLLVPCVQLLDPYSVYSNSIMKRSLYTHAYPTHSKPLERGGTVPRELKTIKHGRVNIEVPTCIWIIALHYFISLSHKLVQPPSALVCSPCKTLITPSIRLKLGLPRTAAPTLIGR